MDRIILEYKSRSEGKELVGYPLCAVGRIDEVRGGRA